MTEKKKRYRKNKKWIPYKQLTPEEREMLRRESNRKQLQEGVAGTEDACQRGRVVGRLLAALHGSGPNQ